MEEVKVIRDVKSIKKPKILPNNRIEILADKKYRFPHAEYRKNDPEIVIVSPEKVQEYHWSLDRKIHRLNTGENRLRFEFLNETWTLDFTLEKEKTDSFVQLLSDSDILIEHASRW